MSVICRFARDYLNLHFKECPIYNNPHPDPLKTIQELLKSCQVCTNAHFSICFWLALLYSMSGMYYSFKQLYRSYKKNNMKFWHRAVFLIGGPMDAACYVLLGLGILTATPPLMKPWMYIKGFILIFYFIFKILLEAIFEGNRATFRAFGNFAVSIIGHVLVLSVYNGFQQAINAGKEENVRLVHCLQPILNKYVSLP